MSNGPVRCLTWASWPRPWTDHQRPASEKGKRTIPCVSEVPDPEVRTGKPIYRGLAKHFIEQMYIDDEAGCFEDEEDVCDEEL